MPSEFKSGFVTIVGRPNVGKSTLINHLLGQKIAAVSPRPQTTRRRQLAILTLDHAQVVFMDTPGLHLPHHKLGAFMNEEAAATLSDADVIVFLVDLSQPPTDEDRLVARRIAELTPQPVIILALNKIDLPAAAELPTRQAEFQSLAPGVPAIQISAQSGYNTLHLLDEIIARLPSGQPFYAEDQVTDLYERDIAADLIREAALIHLRDEVPHAMAVRIDEYAERPNGAAYIAATLFVERESQKPIVIGQGGEVIKKIGSTARKEIEAMSDRKVFLELRVKVAKNWRNNVEDLRRLGFARPEKE